MKKMILTASLMSMLFFSGSALAVDEHHPEKKDAPATAQMKTDQMEMGQMDAQTKKWKRCEKRLRWRKTHRQKKHLCKTICR